MHDIDMSYVFHPLVFPLLYGTEQVNSAKILGITFSRTLFPAQHINITGFHCATSERTEWKVVVSTGHYRKS